MPNIWVIVLIITLFVLCSLLLTNVIRGGAVELPPGFTDASKSIGLVRYNVKKLKVELNKNRETYIFENLPLNSNYEIKESPWEDVGLITIVNDEDKSKKIVQPNISNIGYKIVYGNDKRFTIWIKHSSGLADNFIFAYDSEKKLLLTNGRVVIYPSGKPTNRRVKNINPVIFCPEVELYKSIKEDDYDQYFIVLDKIIYYSDNIYLLDKRENLYNISNPENVEELVLVSNPHANPNIMHLTHKAYRTVFTRAYLNSHLSKLEYNTDIKGQRYKLINVKSIDHKLQPFTRLKIHIKPGGRIDFKKLDKIEFLETHEEIKAILTNTT